MRRTRSTFISVVACLAILAACAWRASAASHRPGQIAVDEKTGLVYAASTLGWKYSTGPIARSMGCPLDTADRLAGVARAVAVNADAQRRLSPSRPAPRHRRQRHQHAGAADRAHGRSLGLSIPALAVLRRPANNRFFATNGENVLVFDGTTNDLIATIELGEPDIAFYAESGPATSLCPHRGESLCAGIDAHEIRLGNHEVTRNAELAATSGQILVAPGSNRIYSVDGPQGFHIIDENTFVEQSVIAAPGAIGALVERQTTPSLRHRTRRETFRLFLIDAAAGTVREEEGLAFLRPRRHLRWTVSAAASISAAHAENRFLLDAELLVNPSFQEYFEGRSRCRRAGRGFRRMSAHTA